MAVSFMSMPVLAGTSITVAADRAKIVNITGEPAAVIIGNPTFADVTVRQGQIIIHGRHYGSTNLLILDERGDELANFELTVAQQPTQAVVMYKAGQRQSYSCAPNCQPTLSVGDSDDYFGKFVQSQISSKTKTAISAAKLSK
ncbi:MAG: pilus assembly protein N-terminal domain-containing protein [Aestuariivirgaceae bacterium]